jgi:hypothetical protein
MCSPLPRSERGWCNHAQYLEDGCIVSDRKGHMDFVSRALYSAAHYFSLQLPEEYDVKIDMDAFLSAFTYNTEDGCRTSANLWNLGPGFRRVMPALPATSSTDVGLEGCASFEFVNQDIIRAEKREKWERYFRWVAAHVPYEVVKSNGQDPLSPDEFIELGEAGSEEETTSHDTNGQREVVSANPIFSRSDMGGRPEGINQIITYHIFADVL